MDAYFLPVLATLVGGYTLIRNIIYLGNNEKLRTYVQKSPRSRLWIGKYGFEKTVVLTRKYFLPLGILSGTALLVIGLWSLSKVI